MPEDPLPNADLDVVAEEQVARRSAGRPSKLTPQRHRIIVDAVAMGLDWKVAAAYAEVSQSSIEHWRRWGANAWLVLSDVLADLDPAEWDRIEGLPDDPTPDRRPTARDLALEEHVPERDRPYLRLFRAVERARAEFELRNIALVQEAAAGYDAVEETTVEEHDEQGRVVRRTVTRKVKPQRFWAAAMTLLERRFPERYAQVSRHEVAGFHGGPIETTVSSPDGGPIEVLHNLTGSTRDERTAAILSILRDAEVLEAEVVDALVTTDGDGAAASWPGEDDDAEADPVRPDRPDA